jgi:hypothetical protein
MLTEVEFASALSKKVLEKTLIEGLTEGQMKKILAVGKESP